MNAVAEGVKTTKAAHDLAHKLGVELPIVEAIHSVVEHGVPAAEAVTELLRREVKAERL
jgi:glycerol-3-phosphate dehydrogenase (NAD(P)+)